MIWFHLKYFSKGYDGLEMFKIDIIFQHDTTSIWLQKMYFFRHDSDDVSGNLSVSFIIILICKFS